jgi:hypothetical protein
MGRQKVQNKKHEKERIFKNPESQDQEKELSKKEKFILLMKEKEKIRELEEEEVTPKEGKEEKKVSELPWERIEQITRIWKECTMREVRKDQIRNTQEITHNSLFQWLWFFIERSKDIPEKLMEECKLLYGILNMEGIKKEWFGEFAAHIGKIVAINKNGIERKGKYKRISRSKEYQRIINTMGIRKIEKEYKRSAEERREKERQEKEEINYFWE